MTFVYFLVAEGLGELMIVSSGDPKHVLGILRQGNSAPLALVGVEKFPGGGAAKARKAKLHSQFRSLHIRGAWFRVNDELADTIEQVLVSGVAHTILTQARSVVHDSRELTEIRAENIELRRKNKWLAKHASSNIHT